MGIWIIFGVFFILSLVAQNRLKSKFKEYSAVPLPNGMSGAEIAAKMLKENGIYDVKLTSVKGQLTDHYNPATKTVNLSPEVFHGRSVAAASVAAHEVGHAIQHAQSYAWLNLRSALVPIQNVSATVINVIFIGMFIGSFLLGGFLPMNTALIIIIACYAIFTVFSLITLPVEFDASRRALVWLSSASVTNYQIHGKAENALRWAASTYVIAALGSLATLLYYLSMFLGSDD